MGLIWLIELFVQVNKFYWDAIAAHYFYTQLKIIIALVWIFIEPNAINLIFEAVITYYIRTIWGA